MEKTKVLYISQEIAPYLPESTMATRGRELPRAVQDGGFEVRTFMPKYGCINERRNQLHEVIRLSGLNIIIDDTDHPLVIKVASLQPARMQVYFIDNDDYFHRSGSKDIEIVSAPEENDERAMFYVRGVIETVKKLRWEPAIVHCSGWISSLAPMYIKKIYNEEPSLRNSKVVFSIYNDAFEGSLSPRFREKLKMDHFTDADIKALGEEEAAQYTHLLSLALEYADAIVLETTDIPETIADIAKASGKPILEAVESETDDERAARYIQFYKTLL